MGRIKKGVLGEFSGTIGRVIGGSWKGIPYIRSFPKNVKNPRTELQMKQRKIFTLSFSFLKPLNGILKTGWKLYAQGKTPLNAAMSYTMTNAIKGNYPEFAIDMEKVLISIGPLTPAINAKVTIVSGAVNFNWDDNSDSEAAGQTDKALIALINSAKRQVVFDDAGAKRSNATQSVNMPADWIGETVDAYLGFVSKDGTKVANSVYLGSLVVA